MPDQPRPLEHEMQAVMICIHLLNKQVAWGYDVASHLSVLLAGQGLGSSELAGGAMLCWPGPS